MCIYFFTLRYVFTFYIMVYVAGLEVININENKEHDFHVKWIR